VTHARREQDLIVTLNQHLVHLDMTLDWVWEETCIADEMNGNWRCPLLDQWLSIEFHIQWHNLFDVKDFKEEDEGNHEKLGIDPFNLGKILLISLYLLLCYKCAY
jgi:hypothetical protein